MNADEQNSAGLSCDIQNCLRQLREGRGLSQGGLGSDLGVSRQTICSIETGKQLPSLGFAFRIARYFEVDIEDIFYPTA